MINIKKGLAMSLNYISYLLSTKRTTNAPLFIKVCKLHEYIETKTVKVEVEHRARAYRDRLGAQTNNLATVLCEHMSDRRQLYGTLLVKPN